MARKNELIATKYKGVKEIVNLQGEKEYIISFMYKGFRINEKNFTKLFNCKTAKQAYERIFIIKHELDNGNDAFNTNTNKIDDLVTAYLSTKSEAYRKNITFTYNKHVKDAIGHKYIERVTENDLVEIKNNMLDLGLSESTIKKVKSVLSPIFIKAFAKGQIKVNVTQLVPMGKHLLKPRLEERLHGSMLDNVRKIYNAILTLEEDKNDEEYKAIFLISIMCARRLGEILKIEHEDIIDGVVNVRGCTTKTFKNFPNNVVERYPLADEVLKIINAKGTKTGLVFTHRERSCMDKYADMIDKKCSLAPKKQGKVFPIRTHDNRHFIMTLCTEKFGSASVGHLALSHRDKSNINNIYLSTEFAIKKKLFDYYWALLRGKITK